MLDTRSIFGLKLNKLIVQLQINDFKFDVIRVDILKIWYRQKYSSPSITEHSVIEGIAKLDCFYIIRLLY